MKYCTDCKYFYVKWPSPDDCGSCLHPYNLERNPVSGYLEKIDGFALTVRKSHKKCGISAKWFEPKPIEPPEVSKWDKFKKLFKKE